LIPLYSLARVKPSSFESGGKPVYVSVTANIQTLSHLQTVSHVHRII